MDAEDVMAAQRCPCAVAAGVSRARTGTARRRQGPDRVLAHAQIDVDQRDPGVGDRRDQGQRDERAEPAQDDPERPADPADGYV